MNFNKKQQDPVKQVLANLSDKKIHVVGVSGMEGYAAAKFLKEKGAQVVGHDFQTEDELKSNFLNLRDYLTEKEKQTEWDSFNNLDITLKLRDEYLEGVEEDSIVFVPQSWFRYDFNNKLRKIKKKATFIGILDLYFNFCSAKIIGITGSSGKSTTSRLIYNIIKTEKNCLLSGNDRESPPVLDKVDDLSKDDYLILEISNRQLIEFNETPYIGLITNLFPTHLDDHPNLAAYKYAKQNLIRNQTTDQFTVLNFDDEEVLDLEKASKGEKYYFSLEKKPSKGFYLSSKKAISAESNQSWIDFNKVKVPGRHNQENILAALCVAKIVGIEKKNVQKACYSFKGLKHRLEYVAKKSGIEFYEDSQSTNSLSSVAALKSFKRPLILIAGGKEKPDPENFALLAEEILDHNSLKAIVLIGGAAGQIKDQIERLGSSQEEKQLNITIAKDLANAFRRCLDIASQGDVCLLSPASESFGEFKDYRQRGDKFKELVNNLND